MLGWLNSHLLCESTGECKIRQVTYTKRVEELSDKRVGLEIVEGELTGWGRLLKEMLEARSLKPVVGGNGVGSKLRKHADDSGLRATSVQKNCSAFREESFPKGEKK